MTCLEFLSLLLRPSGFFPLLSSIEARLVELLTHDVGVAWTRSIFERVVGDSFEWIIRSKGHSVWEGGFIIMATESFPQRTVSTHDPRHQPAYAIFESACLEYTRGARYRVLDRGIVTPLKSQCHVLVLSTPIPFTQPECVRRLCVSSAPITVPSRFFDCRAGIDKLVV